MKRLAWPLALLLLGVEAGAIGVARALPVHDRDLAKGISLEQFGHMEQLERMERETMLRQIGALQRISADQFRLRQQEEALRAGRSPPHSAGYEEPYLVSPRFLQSDAASIARDLPLGVRKQRLTQLLAAGGEVVSREQVALTALSSEQAQLESFAGVSSPRLRDGGKSETIAIAGVPEDPLPDGMADASALRQRESALRASLLRKEAAIEELGNAEASLAANFSSIETGARASASPSSSSGGELEALAYRDVLANFVLLICICMLVFNLSLPLRMAAVVVIVGVYLYFLLGRGFPAKLEKPMAIDYCLGVIAFLIFAVFISVICHVLREAWYGPLPTPGEDVIEDARPSESAAPLPLQAMRSLSGQVAGAPPPDADQTDRERVEENRRIAAEAVLHRAAPTVICGLFLLVMLWFSGVIIFFEGMYIWSKHKEDKCDQPLAQWLLVALILPTLFWWLSCCLPTVYSLVFGILIGVGFMFWDTSKTCYRTSPEIHHFVQLYLLYVFLLWTTYIFSSYGVVVLAMWLQESGLLTNIPKPGRPGLVNELEDVPFREGMEPDECCICCDQFNVERPIKRTSCGHVFHKECLGEWLERWNSTCPVCRLDLDQADPEAARAAEPATRTGASNVAAPARHTGSEVGASSSGAGAEPRNAALPFEAMCNLRRRSQDQWEALGHGKVNVRRATQADVRSSKPSLTFDPGGRPPLEVPIERRHPADWELRAQGEDGTTWSWSCLGDDGPAEFSVAFDTREAAQQFVEAIAAAPRTSQAALRNPCA